MPLTRMVRSGAARMLAVRALRGRPDPVFRLYASISSAMDDICARYTDAELELLADFLRRATDVGRGACEDLADH